ncbi:MAG: YceI family protein [Candidatus Korobacteraceae bacterium]
MNRSCWRSFGLAFAWFALFSGQALAEEAVVTLDPAKTQVEFILESTFHTVHGSFKLKSGRINFDIASGAASGAIVVDASSGNSGNRSRDSKMHKDVLESARYPEIVFIPHKVIGTVAQEASRVEISGTFRIHGAEHELMLTVPLTINGNSVSASTDFAVPYQAWGMKNPSALFLRVSDKVSISIRTVGSIGRTVSAR